MWIVYRMTILSHSLSSLDGHSFAREMSTVSNRRAEVGAHLAELGGRLSSLYRRLCSTCSSVIRDRCVTVGPCLALLVSALGSLCHFCGKRSASKVSSCLYELRAGVSTVRRVSTSVEGFGVGLCHGPHCRDIIRGTGSFTRL